MFAKEWLPHAIALGISYKDFWSMNPRIINAYAEGHRMQVEEQDYLNWIHGQYMFSAINFALDCAFNGNKATSKYAEHPFLSSQPEKSEEEKAQEELDKMIANELLWVQTDKLNNNLSRNKSQG